MQYAADFRSTARDALSGKWGTAVVAGLIAALLGGTTSSGPEFKLNIDNAGSNIEFGGMPIYNFDNGWAGSLGGMLLGIAAAVLLIVLVIGVVLFIVGSVVEVGYARFGLDLVDQQTGPEIGTLFTYFSHWKTTAAARLLRTVFIFLWSLLFIIPGLVARYSYAMTGFILSEHPELTASEAIDRSKEMMYGNRFRLFCLEISFIGWDLLCILTLGIGHLWLDPYKHAATAAFYREVSGTIFSIDQ